MIVKAFNIKDLNLKFFVGIDQVKLDIDKLLESHSITNDEEGLRYFFTIIEEIQNRNKNSIIQFFKEKYVLNTDHIFTACYYVEKAFLQKNNISNKKNIEILLYLATNRQINKSIKAFGIDYSDLYEKSILYCIVSPLNNINEISSQLMNLLYAEQREMSIGSLSKTKINLIKEFFEISNSQLNSVLKSYGIITDYSELDLNLLGTCLYDLICEKMALLHVEKIKTQ